MKKHHKHANLVKPQGGKYHRNEIGLIGAPCGIIQKLTLDISDHFSSIHKVSFMDADHNTSHSESNFQTKYTDKIGFHQIAFHEEDPEYFLRQNFYSSDLLLVNGNHFVSDKQIVLINEKKKDSLHRKLDRLTNVIAFILDEGMSTPFDFLNNGLGNYGKIPIIKLSDKEEIFLLIEEHLSELLPPISGLLLYGGKSQRMGEDKGQFHYHGVPHIEYLANILDSFCDNVKISVANENNMDLPYEQFSDSFTGLGPFGGILSAFRNDPNRAYLSLPCDVPFIDNEFIKRLIDNRDTSKVATCYHNKETNFPEPLITIWEPKAYPIMLHFLSLGYSCPRKVLINSEIKEIMPSDDIMLYNANTKDEAEFARSRIQNTF